ncbi:MAG: nuclear transport factor 2 family protein [Alphaproteobacteria bacterium]
MPTPREVVERWYATLDRELIDPDTIWEIAAGSHAAGTWRGRRAVFEDYFPKLRAPFASWGATVESIHADGDVVFGLGHYVARARGASEDRHIPFCHVWWVADGRIVRARQYADTVLLRDAAAQTGAK